MKTEQLLSIRKDYYDYSKPIDNCEVFTYRNLTSTIEFFFLKQKLIEISVFDMNGICRRLSFYGSENYTICDVTLSRNTLWNRYEGECIIVDRLSINVYRYIYPDAIYHILPPKFLIYHIRKNLFKIIKNLINEIF